ncbi:protocatechuate 3,4-dioxygenase subunit alpha [Nonomuraea cavernae]|uniref:Protocatechuate 3,4-dioxygenase subunit alpha n=1 Tax=Nonomuraea cavernae TaxID=2045107 RepID=A0A917ZC00_9ACTN|nr:protocatechuate 3,4-dioxygenase subunit alpha [Nonomuraea cavernae]MCA2190302.1 protocatechuate 3,4-dioxygenase subunit alpha [Nonomuraea cavernae]GGO80570.1 protocatechuate 3,4-dioxygenase subunit alpha [Nonomuraea cavernae]
MTLTPSQTVGPFYGYALPYEHDWELVAEGHPEAITLSGRVLDGAGEPVPDALLELWLGFTGDRGALLRGDGLVSGFGRCGTAPDGSYRFRTVRPSGPYLSLQIFARGLLRSVLTRVYLEDRPDPLLDSLDPARRRTLIATGSGDSYHFDVRLQGTGETVFLDF